MFDIGFSELLLIGVVALVVIGPEKLPRVARTAGVMFGRLQRYVNEVKSEINREVELEELRKLRTQVQDAARDIEQSVTRAAREVETGVGEVGRELAQAGASATATATASATATATATATASLSDLPPLSEPSAEAAATEPAPAPAPAAAQPVPEQGTLPLAEPGAR